MDVTLNCEKVNTKSIFKIRVNNIIFTSIKNGYLMLWPIDILYNAGAIDKLKYEEWRAGELATLDSAFNCKMKELRELAFHIKNQLETYTNTMRQYERTAAGTDKPLVISDNRVISKLLACGFFVDRVEGGKIVQKKRSLGRYYYNKMKQKKKEIDDRAFTREAREIRREQACS